mmetsp:Transcript_8565/g.20812  ORF Transcript_8565/g.20812 Transcript_8565/m.20812 type:complete len:337 (+) Transcript_8565:1011-2021(+)
MAGGHGEGQEAHRAHAAPELSPRAGDLPAQGSAAAEAHEARAGRFRCKGGANSDEKQAGGRGGDARHEVGEEEGAAGEGEKVRGGAGGKKRGKGVPLGDGRAFPDVGFRLRQSLFPHLRVGHLRAAGGVWRRSARGWHPGQQPRRDELEVEYAHECGVVPTKFSVSFEAPWRRRPRRGGRFPVAVLEGQQAVRGVAVVHVFAGVLASLARFSGTSRRLTECLLAKPPARLRLAGRLSEPGESRRFDSGPQALLRRQQDPRRKGDAAGMLACAVRGAVASRGAERFCCAQVAPAVGDAKGRPRYLFRHSRQAFACATAASAGRRRVLVLTKWTGRCN